MGMPRSEHPRSQFARDEWLNLNGTWQFEVDQGDSGLERGLRDRDLASSILIPFAPESTASGVGNTDFLQAVWYRRQVTIPEEWSNKRVLLHFGAVDHDTTVWANGVEAARHRGGFSSFTADLSGAVAAGTTVTIVVRARDLNYEVQARGKQATCMTIRTGSTRALPASGRRCGSRPYPRHSSRSSTLRQISREANSMIELAMEAGLNGARLHQKAFEERYFYHADRLWFLVWAEFGDWGVSGLGQTGHNQKPTASFVSQWLEAVERHRNDPSIIGWCPLNETHQLLHDRITILDDVTSAMFLATKLADPTRPAIDASGYSHRVNETDVYDSHSYEQDPQITEMNRPDYDSSWECDRRVLDEEEYYARFQGLVEVLRSNPLMFGYCFTQLADVFQEQNGIYRFDRSPKLDVARIRAIQSRAVSYEAG